MSITLAPSGKDDAAAIQAAATKVAVTGGDVLFSPGVYNVSSTLIFDKFQNVRFKAVEGSVNKQTQWSYPVNPVTTLIFTGTGTQTFISAQQSLGVGFEGLTFRWASRLWTGIVIDFTNPSGAGHADGGNANYLRDCAIFAGPQAYATQPVTLLAIDGNLGFSADRVYFYGGQYNVTGCGPAAGFVQLAEFRNCNLQAAALAGIRNCGYSWKMDSCNIEVFGAPIIEFDQTKLGFADYQVAGISLTNCWIGDPNPGSTQALITIPGNVYALSVFGGTVGVPSAGAFIRFSQSDSRGVCIQGVHFGGLGTSIGIDFGATTQHFGFVAIGNNWGDLAVDVAGTIPPGALIQRRGQ